MKHCLDKKPAGTTDAETALNKRDAKKEANEAYMAMAFIAMYASFAYFFSSRLFKAVSASVVPAGFLSRQCFIRLL